MSQVLVVQAASLSSYWLYFINNCILGGFIWFSPLCIKISFPNIKVWLLSSILRLSPNSFEECLSSVEILIKFLNSVKHSLFWIVDHKVFILGTFAKTILFLHDQFWFFMKLFESKLQYPPLHFGYYSAFQFVSCFILLSQGEAPLVKPGFHYSSVQVPHNLLCPLVSAIFASYSLCFILFFGCLNFSFYRFTFTLHRLDLHGSLLLSSCGVDFPPFVESVGQVATIHSVNMCFQLVHVSWVRFAKVSPFYEILFN